MPMIDRDDEAKWFATPWPLCLQVRRLQEAASRVEDFRAPLDLGVWRGSRMAYFFSRMIPMSLRVYFS